MKLLLLYFNEFDTYLQYFYILPVSFDDTKREVFFLNWSVVILSLDLSNDNVPVWM